MILYVGLNPPYRIRNQAHSLVWIELSDRHHQPYIPLLDKVEHFQAVVPKLISNFYHKSQIGGNQAVGGCQILVFKKCNRIATFFFLAQQGEFSNLVHIKPKTISYNR